MQKQHDESCFDQMPNYNHLSSFCRILNTSHWFFSTVSLFNSQQVIVDASFGLMKTASSHVVCCLQTKHSCLVEFPLFVVCFSSDLASIAIFNWDKSQYTWDIFLCQKYLIHCFPVVRFHTNSCYYEHPDTSTHSTDSLMVFRACSLERITISLDSC